MPMRTRAWNTGDTIDIISNKPTGEHVVVQDREETFVTDTGDEYLVRSDVFTYAVVARGNGGVGDFVRVSYFNLAEYWFGEILDPGNPNGDIIIKQTHDGQPIALPLTKPGTNVKAVIDVLIPRS